MRAVILSHAYVTSPPRGKLRALAGLGCSVAVAVPDRWVDPRGGTVASADWDDDGGVRVVPVPVRGDAGRADLARWDRRALQRLLRDFRPDLLQIEEEPRSYVAAMATAQDRRLHIPSVILTMSSPARPATIGERLRRRRVLRTVAGVVAGNHLAERLVVEVQPDIARSVIPQIGVALPAAASDPGGPLAIGFFGRLVPEKGLDLLLRACVRLLGDWTLEVVGSGPAQVELEALAERLGIAARVTWHGALPARELSEVWEGLRCVVMPSRTTRDWIETSGQPAVLAMAHGLPAVVTRTGALPATVEEGGLIVPEDDVPALAAALQRLVDDPAGRAEIGAAGRRRAMAFFSNEALARRQLEFWRGLLRASD